MKCYNASFAGYPNSRNKSGMNRLSRYLFLLSLVFLVSLGIFIASIYLRESQISLYSNASSFRVLTFIVLAAAAGFLFGSALLTWKNPIWGQKALSRFERLINQEWIHQSIFLLSVLGIVLFSIPLWNVILQGDARYLLLLYRFSPIALLVCALSLMVIRSIYFEADRNVWIKLVLFSSLCFAAGILFQSILENKLDRPLPVSIPSQF